ncbi:hypothetical protein BV25DRAFT_455500 [Artomyces pyxidatus]|uniref:Uncharacterized protein n=1 Tax=Artomyces pyxidatus TaxID=48021 RepID=A0ACB8T2V5_9AGAM|nr:hypothetical protein BV25DRAFT_455500 [Artomyces pyxidatus]
MDGFRNAILSEIGAQRAFQHDRSPRTYVHRSSVRRTVIAMRSSNCQSWAAGAFSIFIDYVPSSSAKQAKAPATTSAILFSLPFIAVAAFQVLVRMDRLLLLAVLSASFFTHVRASSEPFLEQGFFFDYNPPGTTIPIPVTAQCDTIHITWERGSATGPNPVAPYYLQIYTSTFIVPFVVAAGEGTSFDFDVPFTPGTQYQVCMFDKNGVTGGCQGIYTVIPSTSSQQPPTCNNVTFPAGAMDVDAYVAGGAFSQYGWIPQCTDISVTAKNGTGPYTFTVAPTLHPPLNITSKTGNAINWTVALSHGFPFFISLVDSAGNMWSQGPLHSGDGDTGCLDLDARSHSTVPEAAAVGSAIGGLALGAILGITLFYFFQRMRSRRGGIITVPRHQSSWDSPHGQYETVLNSAGLDPELAPLAHGPSRDLSSTTRDTRATGSTGTYVVEPFAMPMSTGSNNGHSGHSIMNDSTMPAEGSGGSGPSEPGASTGPGGQQVYVLHHDGGRPPPVTVFTVSGTEVVELPPRYADNGSPQPLQQQRQPGPTTRKTRRAAS